MFKKKLMRLLLSASVAVVMLASAGYAADTDTADVDVLVQPSVDVTITASPTYYDFGVLDVNTSSNSASAVNLSNDGEVDVTLQSHVEAIATEDSGSIWTLANSTGTDQFTLYHAVNDAGRIDLTNYADNHKLTGSAATLYEQDGTTESEIAQGANKDSWFRIDMPTAVSDTEQKTFTVRVTATSK